MSALNKAQEQFFAPTLAAMEMALRALERRVPPPVLVPWKGSFVFRYAERTIQQAIVQKLARTISGLHAVDTLLARGLFQEQGVIHRVLDELDEDVLFLSFGVIHCEITERHKQYLDYFYAEEFGDADEVIVAHKSRGMVPRDKIRAFNNRHHGDDASRANLVHKVIAKAYSGFVHAASPHIMEMYGGMPLRFDVKGESQERLEEHVRDAVNYFYRGLASMTMAAKALGDESLFSELYARAAAFEAMMYP